jgi:Ca-activated chloride channel family protein
MSDKPSANGHVNAAELQAAQVTAYALGQVDEAEAAEVEKLLAAPAYEHLRRQVADMRQLDAALDAAPVSAGAAANDKLRMAVEMRLDELTPGAEQPTSYRARLILGIVGSLCAALLLAFMFLPNVQMARESSRQTAKAIKGKTSSVDPFRQAKDVHWNDATDEVATATKRAKQHIESDPTGAIQGLKLIQEELKARPGIPAETRAKLSKEVGDALNEARRKESETNEVLARTRQQEAFAREAAPQAESKPKSSSSLATRMDLYEKARQTDLPRGESRRFALAATPRIIVQEEEESLVQVDSKALPPGGTGNEQYELPPENPFRNVREAPLSTFSIDVDTASYANVRRFLNSGRLPPPAAVRIEELLNYFSYSYPQPKGDEPFSVNLESAECPWRPGHLLLRVGLKGKEVHRAERPSSNLVFLVDVSGSMADENKLPLLKTSLAMMATHLTASDRVSIVVYAGEAGTKLDSARGNEQDKILNVIQSLGAGGSTHGSAGIQVAYDLAKKNFITGGVNRVIWATDGDLNVGVTDDESLVTLIKEKAASGVFLTVLGVGEGNLKDAKLEKLADNGNGLYAYLDTIKEAHKVLIEQMSGSLVTIAKDVKLQIEFNPAEVAAYRLIGYENRMLAARDFHDDKKDAGEIGAGHTVTALYELIPAGLKEDQTPPPEGELKYQKPAKAAVEEKPAPGQLSDAAASGELLTLKLRYKQPDAERSVLREFPLKERGGRFTAASRDFQFASAVAQFGMLLRGSEHRGGSSWSAVAETVAATVGDDSQGLRAEFVELIRKAERLQGR